MAPVYLMNFLFAVSTTIGMTFIPLLVTNKLGLSLFILGIIEGSTEFISNILRLLTGNMFDRIKNKRLLFIIPPLLAFFSKIILYFPNTWTITLSKINERAANGAFAAPRDAYIGENAKNKGIALGWLSVTKTFGCVIGPLIVGGSTLILGPLEDNIFIIISLACVLNFIALILSFKVNFKNKLNLALNEEFNFKELKALFKQLRFLFIISYVFFLGRFNDGIIMLYLKSEGFPEWFYLTTISFFNIIMLLISPLIGLLIDRKRDYQMLLLTILSLLFFNTFFSNINKAPWIFAIFGLVCWGIQRAGAQITFSAFIFKQTPVKFYGTAIGVYSLLSGLGIFISSFVSGYFADINFKYVFYLSFISSSSALILTWYRGYKKTDL